MAFMQTTVTPLSLEKYFHNFLNNLKKYIKASGDLAELK